MPPAKDPVAASLTALVGGVNRDPFAVLGPHPVERGRGTVVRAFHPAAKSIELRLMSTGELRPMTRRGDGGVFEAIVEPGEPREPLGPREPREPPEPLELDYRLRLAFADGHVVEVDDAYRYGQVLGDLDLHLLGEGTHLTLYRKLGAHRITVGSTTGVHFAVWAPNADRVSVIGDFNGWDGRVHAMRLLSPSGVWEIFVPDLPDGEHYKFEIRTKTGSLLQKTRSLRRRIRGAAALGCCRARHFALRLGRRGTGCRRGATQARGSIGRWRSTKCTSVRGRACQRTGTAS